MKMCRGQLTLGVVLLAAAMVGGCHHEARSPGLSEAERLRREVRAREAANHGSANVYIPGPDVKVNRVEDLIVGRFPGVRVVRLANGRPSVRVRGSNTFMGGEEPLFVIDGMPINSSSAESALAGINPRDVARIEVLKDAGETSIYGSRGANGVILISTKRGF